MSNSKKKITIVLPNLKAGGAEKIMLSVAKYLIEKGAIVHILLFTIEGEFVDQIPPNAKIYSLFKNPRLLNIKMLMFGSIKFIRHLNKKKPDIVISTLTKTNLLTILFSKLSNCSPRIVIREAASLLNVKSKTILVFIRLLYPLADKVICVSQGVKSDLSKSNIPEDKLFVINNPVDIHTINILAQVNPEHIWFQHKEVPIVIAIGRLVIQKGFDSLIQAFSILVTKIKVRMLILGDGPERNNLQKLIKRYKLQSKVQLIGFESNPYAFLKRADLFVLSSRWEGFVNVLVEAMAVGIPIVATDCHSGPAEILENGKLGYLVPVDNVLALASAMQQVLEHGQDTELLRKRVMDFSNEEILKQYFIHILT